MIYQQRFCLGASFALCVLAGCHNVQYTANNVDTKALTPVVEEIEGSDKVVQQVSMGSVDAGASTTATIKVHNGNAVRLIASNANGFKVFDNGNRTVTQADPDPLKLTTAFQQRIANMPTGDEAAAALGQMVTSVAPLYDGFSAPDITGAVQRYWGALLVVQPAPFDEKSQSYTGDGRILSDDVTASIFSSAITIAENDYPKFDESRETKMDGKTAIDFSAKFPAFGGGSFNFSNDDVYDLKWSMSGAGWKVRPDLDKFNPYEKIGLLSADTKKALFNKLKQNPGSQLMYVTQVYIVRDISNDVTVGTTGDVKGGLNVGSVITANGEYSFNANDTKHTDVGARLLNINGFLIDPSFVTANAQGGWMPADKATADDFAADRVTLIPKNVTAPQNAVRPTVVPKVPSPRMMYEAHFHKDSFIQEGED